MASPADPETTSPAAIVDSISCQLVTVGPRWIERPDGVWSGWKTSSIDDPLTALARSYDILIHLHDVQAAHLR